MSRRLKTTVLVTAPPGGAASFATFGPDDTEIPDWALEQMGDHCFESGGEAKSEDGYAAFSVEDLKAEIDRRNEDRDEAEHLSKQGKKAELIAALEADDAA